MLKEDKINGYQLALLLMGFIFGSTAIFTPATAARQDAWLAFILGWGGGFFLTWMYCQISAEQPSQTLTQILIYCFGKYAGKAIAILYVWYFIHLAALILRNFGEYLAVTIYLETPVVFTIALLALVTAYSVKKGLKIFSRAAEMLMPYLFIFMIATFLLLVGKYDVRAMLPVLEQGIWPVIKAAFGVLTFPFGEVVVFMMVFPQMYKPKILKKTVLSSAFFIGFFILGIILRDLWTLGPDLLSRATFPPSLSTQLIPNITLDPIVAIDLLIGGWIKIGICIYAATLGITQIVNVQNYKPYVYPVAAISVAVSIWLYDNIFEMLRWVDYYSFYVIPFQILIPGLLLIILKIKKPADQQESSTQLPNE